MDFNRLILERLYLYDYLPLNYFKLVQSNFSSSFLIAQVVSRITDSEAVMNNNITH